MKGLKTYIRPYVWAIVLAMAIKFLATVLDLAIPWLMELILDEAVPSQDRHMILFSGGGMLLCSLGSMGFNILANRISAISSGKIVRSVRHDLFQKLESLSARQMDALTVSSAESRLTSDTYNINQFLNRTQRMGIRAPILLLGGILMMVSMDASLAMVPIALLPIIVVVVWQVRKHSVPLYLRQQSVLDRMVLTLQENITGIRVIKALSKTDYEKQRFENVNNELTAVDRKAGTVTAITNPVASLTLNLGLTLVVVAGAVRVNGGNCEPGVVVAFLQYFVMILNAMMGITNIFVLWSKGEASASRVSDVLASEEDLLVQPAEEEPEENAPHIRFRNVNFSYTGVGANVENLSFTLEHGQTLGILGPTGSGKSTILNLLLRLYDPDSGEILLDGQDIRTMERDELRRKFGVVFQNDFLMEGTIGENIGFFRPLTDQDLDQAAEDAQAEFVEQREKGMDSEVVVRGNNLSGGQRQRLLIARALAADPEILVLDDASSALDYQTDARLRHALREHYRRSTTVLVAQRISSLQHADLILVLDEGRVIGAGTHAQLLETCEEYQNIARTQMGTGKEAV